MPRRRLGRHLANIAQDDRLLLKEGKGANLSQEEVAQALWERGMWVTLAPANFGRPD